MKFVATALAVVFISTAAVSPAPATEAGRVTFARETSAVDDAEAKQVWAAVCLILMTWSGGPADNPPTFDIRADGDVIIAEEVIIDCAPHGTSGN